MLGDTLKKGNLNGLIHPVDRGWAWFILLGAFLNFTIIVGTLKCSGIFFVIFQQRYQASSTMTSVISSVQNISCSISSFLVMTVGMKYMTCRMSVLIGGILNCGAFVITAVVEDIRVVALSHGLLLGIGSGFIVNPTRVIIGQYFESRSGLANSVMNSGAGLGGLVFPILLFVLNKRFGYMGGFLIMGGIMLNVMISGALFRPRSFYTRKQLSTSNLETGYLEQDGQQASCMRETLTDRQESDIEIQPPLKSESSTGVILQDCTSTTTTTIAVESTCTLSARCSRLPKSFLNLLDLSLLQESLFSTILLSQATIITGLMLVTTFVAPHARDVDCSDSQITYLFTIIQALDAVVSPLIGMIADKVRHNRVFIELVGASLMCISTQCISLYSEHSTMFVFVIILGMLRSSSFVMLAVLYVDFLGVSKLKGALGYHMLLEGVFQAVLYPVIGKIRDVTGSYRLPYHLLGIFIGIGVALMIVAARMKSKRNGQYH